MLVEVEIPEGETCIFSNGQDCKFLCYTDDVYGYEAYCRLLEKKLKVPDIKNKKCPAYKKVGKDAS